MTLKFHKIFQTQKKSNLVSNARVTSQLFSRTESRSLSELTRQITPNVLDSVSYLDNCGNSGANTCVQAPTHGGALLLD
jgi:hypothetical protein